MQEKRELNLRDKIERVWRNRDNIILFQLITIVLTLCFVLFWPRKYGSEAQLFIQRGHESISIDPTATAGGAVAIAQSQRESEIKTALEVLRSRGIIEPVVDRVGPGVVLGSESLPGDSSRSNPVADFLKGGIGWVGKQARKIDPASDRERAIEEIESNLGVDAQRKSEVIEITFEADSPQLAQHIVRAVIQEYTRKHPELRKTQGSTDFFEDQNKRLQTEFEEVSNRLKLAKNEVGVVSIGEQTKILEDHLGEVRQDMMDTQKRLSASRALTRDLANQLASVPSRLSSAAVTKASHAADLQSPALFSLKIQLSEAEAKLTPNHPKVKALRESVRKAEREHNKERVQRREKADDINPVHEKLSVAFTQRKAEMAGLVAAAEKLNQQEVDVIASIKKLNEDSIAIRLLEVEAKTAEDKLVSYGASLEDARVNDEREARSMSSVVLSQPATLQEKPISPPKMVTLAAGAALCLLGSLLLAFLNIQNDDTLISPYALSTNVPDVPVFGSLPRSRSFAKVLS